MRSRTMTVKMTMAMPKLLKKTLYSMIRPFNMGLRSTKFQISIRPKVLPRYLYLPVFSSGWGYSQSLAPLSASRA